MKVLSGFRKIVVAEYIHPWLSVSCKSRQKLCQ